MAPPASVYDDDAFYDDARFRILSKSEVGGVIFYCNEDEIAECLEKKLLGLQLPWPVNLEKIDHGMPLFLFNKTERKFHGTFERADDGKEKRFIQIRPKPNQQYPPLPLAHLKGKMYHADLHLFDMPYVYFESHHIETEDLLALFQGSPTDLDLKSLSISAQTTVDDYHESCKVRFQQAVSYYASLKEAKAKDKVEDEEMDNVEDDEMDNMEGERMQLYKWEYEDWEYELMKNEVLDEDYDEDAWRMGGYIEY